MHLESADTAAPATRAPVTRRRGGLAPRPLGDGAIARLGLLGHHQPDGRDLERSDISAGKHRKFPPTRHDLTCSHGLETGYAGSYFVTPANDAQRLEVVSGAYLELGDGDLLLSGRDRPVVLLVLAPDEPDKVYVLEHGRAELWSVARSEPAADLAELQVPGLGDLTGGVAGDRSLEAEFEQLRTSADALDRLAATGLLLRFWVPGDRDARSRWVHALAIGESPLRVATKRWYSSLPGETRRAASEVAEAELRRLRDTLLRLGSGTGADESKPLATRLALGRDRLESVRRLMATAGGGEALTQAVHAFDDLAVTHLTQLSEAGVSDARLRRVFVSEPEAWWGAIAR